MKCRRCGSEDLVSNNTALCPPCDVLYGEDPCDGIDATWIPQEKRIIWCPVHKEPMESCGCGRHRPVGTAFVIVLILAILGCLSLVVGAFVGL